jgi:uncharacterized membrane protein HdeD (DUF308 family)
MSDPFATRSDRGGDASAFWWVYLFVGVLWLLFSLLVFRFDATSIHAISIIFGVVCLAAAVTELFGAGTASGGWRIARALLAVAFAVIGVLCFVHPGNTFNALAAVFAFYLLIRGVFEIVVAFLVRGEDLWWVGLVTGMVQVVLAFWAAGDFGHKAVLLLVWVGVSALAAGIKEIIVALQLRAESKPAAA